MRSRKTRYDLWTCAILFCLLREWCAGLTQQLEAGVHHQLTTRFKSHPFIPHVGLWVGGFDLHIGDQQEQTREFYSVASCFCIYIYILIYVKRFIFFVSVIWFSVTIKNIHLVLFWIVFFAFASLLITQ